MNGQKPKSYRKFLQAILAEIFFMYMAYKTDDVAWAMFICVSAGIFAQADLAQKKMCPVRNEIIEGKKEKKKLPYPFDKDDK